MITEHTSNVPVWASVASAFAASLAAGASWRSTLQAKRAWRAGQLPYLVTTVALEIETGHITIHVVNAGPGLAIRVGFYVIDGDEVVKGSVNPHGFLRSGEDVSFATEFTPKDRGWRWSDLENGWRLAKGRTPWINPGVVVCFDHEGRLHAWDVVGRHLSWGARWQRKQQVKGFLPQILNEFFPGTNHMNLKEVTCWREGQPPQRPIAAPGATNPLEPIIDT